MCMVASFANPEGRDMAIHNVHSNRKRFIHTSDMARSCRKAILGLFGFLGCMVMALSGIAVCYGGEPIEPKPLWEVGLFNIAARLPLYRGSGSDRWYVFPLPYLIYRGDIIQANREGVKGIFYKKGHIETNVSLYGNPPVETDDDTRDDMPDLDAIAEIGPSARWHFLEQGMPDTFYAEAALRAAQSLGWDKGLDIEYQGLHGVLRLCYYNVTRFRDQGLSFGGTVGIDWADDRLNGYFYDVDPKYERPGREAFHAGAGYAGFSLSASGQKRLTDSLWLGVFSRWENVTGTVYEKSPLVEKENNLSLGCALIWQIAVSDRTASTGAGNDLP
jgi:MipA family protein